MGNEVEAKASLVQRCAKFLMSKMRTASPEVQAAAGPVVAEGYFKGATDALTEVIGSCNDAMARNPDCASCPALQEVKDGASDLLAQCHGATAEQIKS